MDVSLEPGRRLFESPGFHVSGQERGGWSTTRIGRFYNGRHHTTVLHAIEKIERLRQTDESLEALIDVITGLGTEGSPTRQFQPGWATALISAVADRVLKKIRDLTTEGKADGSKRGLARRKDETVSKLGVDEKAFTRGRRYFTLVNDLDRSRVLFVGENRTTQTLDEFRSSLTAEQLTGVEAVAMDMWDHYIKSTKNHLPDADKKIVFDKFHIVKHLSEAVDLVRRLENRTLRSRGDDRLKGTHYDWLKHPATMEPEDRKEFYRLRNSNLKAGGRGLLNRL